MDATRERRRAPVWRSARLWTVLSLLALVGAVAAPAGAEGGGEVTYTAEAIAFSGDPLIGPFGIDFDLDGNLIIADAFGGAIVRADLDAGTTTRIVELPGVSDVEIGGAGRITAAVGAPGSVLKRADADGENTTDFSQSIADFEANNNPDRFQTYGFLNPLAPECEAQLPDEFPRGTYTGIVDSNPFGVNFDRYNRIVADAATNAILAVRPTGEIRTVGVLPPIPQVFTAEAIERVEDEFEVDLPDCLLDVTYWGEPVPTSVVKGADGYYYIGTLPGVPENPGSAKVFRMNPRNGAVEIFVDGLTSVVDLTFGPDGSLYVVELFASIEPGPPGAIEKIETSLGANGKLVAGDRSVVATGADGVAFPNGAVVGADGTIYATTGALPGAPAIVRITPGPVA